MQRIDSLEDTSMQYALLSIQFYYIDLKSIVPKAQQPPSSNCCLGPCSEDARLNEWGKGNDRLHDVVERLFQVGFQFLTPKGGRKGHQRRNYHCCTSSLTQGKEAVPHSFVMGFTFQLEYKNVERQTTIQLQPQSELDTDVSIGITQDLFITPGSKTETPLALVGQPRHCRSPQFPFITQISKSLVTISPSSQ